MEQDKIDVRLTLTVNSSSLTEEVVEAKLLMGNQQQQAQRRKALALIRAAGEDFSGSELQSLPWSPLRCLIS